MIQSLLTAATLALMMTFVAYQAYQRTSKSTTPIWQDESGIKALRLRLPTII
jgi:hypothetical protein